ncbi:MAG: phosphotransferase [Trueperaceae bacterium]
MMDVVGMVLKYYGLENATTKLMRDYENLIYRVEANQTYALRLCTPEMDEKILATEVNWLAAIRNETDVLVPKPVLNKEGNFISHAEGRLCVLFEWLEGEPVSKTMSEEVASHVGTMMAELHRQASSYQSEAFAGTTFDEKYFFGRNSWWQTKAKERLAEGFESVVPAIEKTKAIMQRLGTSSQHFGMTHTDIHFGNVIRSGDTFALLDFGSYGLGYYLMDIAVTEAEFEDYPNAGELIGAFRESYKITLGSIPSDDDIRTFGVTSCLLFLEWVFESSNEKVRQDKAMWLPSTIETLRKLAS